jgi:hypothetical protein
MKACTLLLLFMTACGSSLAPKEVCIEWAKAAPDASADVARSAPDAAKE